MLTLVTLQRQNSQQSSSLVYWAAVCLRRGFLMGVITWTPQIRLAASTRRKPRWQRTELLLSSMNQVPLPLSPRSLLAYVTPSSFVSPLLDSIFYSFTELTLRILLPFLGFLSLSPLALPSSVFHNLQRESSLSHTPQCFQDPGLLIICVLQVDSPGYQQSLRGCLPRERYGPRGC